MKKKSFRTRKKIKKFQNKKKMYKKLEKII